MRVLVTGGAGYIGSHSVRALVAQGHEVVVLDTLEHGHREAIGEVPLIVGTAGDRALVRDLLVDARIEAVIHLAAYKSVEESVRSPERYVENNVRVSQRLLDAMAEARVDRLVFSSSCAVYGSPERLPVDEEAPLRPENPYGESKLLVERVLAAASGLRWIALRYFNAAGAALDGSIGEDWSDAPNLVPVVLKAAMGRIPELPVFGTDYPTLDGTAIRDYTHVLDIADAHVRALEALGDGEPSGVLNVGTGRGYSVREVVEAARAQTGAPIPVRELGRRPGDPAMIWADSRRIQRRLGWLPRYGIDEIIATAWQWHLGHPDGFAAPQVPAAPGSGRRVVATAGSAARSPLR